MGRRVGKPKARKLCFAERAVVRPLDAMGGEAFGSTQYCEIVDLSPHRLKMLSSESMPAGQQLEIAVSLTRWDDTRSVSGVVRTATPCAGGRKYLLDVDVVRDELATQWRYQFN